MTDKDQQLNALMRAISDLSARVQRLERAEYGAGAAGRITAGSVTLQLALSAGQWYYGNTQITHNAGTDDCIVLLAVEDAPAIAWVTDRTPNTCVLWAATDRQLVDQAATPTIRYIVLR
jgi:hypothetical protein